MNAERSKTTKWTVKAEELLTQEINPKPAYVETCLKKLNEQGHLKKPMFSGELYMIVGIMGATNATVSNEVGQKRLFGGKIGANLAVVTGGAAPLDVHAKAQMAAERGAKASFGKSDFVLGYKLRKITYLRSFKVSALKDVKGKGTVLDENEVPQAAEVEKETEVKFIRLEEDAVGSEEFELADVAAQVVGDNGGGNRLKFVLPVNAEGME